jgi:hypothetical protein
MVSRACATLRLGDGWDRSKGTLMPRGHVQFPESGEEWAGVNLSVHPSKIADNELAWSQDTVEYEPGILRRRQSPLKLASQVTEAQIGNGAGAQDSFLIQYLDEKNRFHLLIFCGTSNVNNQPSLIEIDSVTGAYKTTYTIASQDNSHNYFPPRSPFRRPQWRVWRRKLFIFPGVDWPPIVFTGDSMDQGYGAPLPWAASGDGIAPHPGVGAFHQDVLCSAAFDQQQEEALIRFCVTGTPNNLLADASAVNVGRGDGDQIIGLESTAVLGGAQAIDPYLMVWKQRSTWILQGNLPTTLDVGSVKEVRLMPDEGLVSFDTVAATKYGLVWCSGKSVWLMDPSAQKPVEIGLKIAPVLRTLPRSYNSGWNASYFDGWYRLSVPLPVDYSEFQNYSIILHNDFTHGDTILTPNKDSGGNPYNFQFCAQFWCDLRRGLDKLKWYGPMMVPFTSQLVKLPGSGQESLISLGCMWTPLQTQLRVYDWTQDVGPLDNFGRTVTQLIRFKEFDFGDGKTEKSMDAIEMDIAMDVDPAALGQDPNNPEFIKNPPIQVGFVANQGTVNDTWNAPAVPSPDTGYLASIQSGQFILDTSQLDKTAELAGKFFTVVAYPFNGRHQGRKFQPQIQVVKSTYPPTDVGFLTSEKAVWPSISLASVGMQMQIIGRRPTGTAGSGIP